MQSRSHRPFFGVSSLVAMVAPDMSKTIRLVIGTETVKLCTVIHKDQIDEDNLYSVSSHFCVFSHTTRETLEFYADVNSSSLVSPGLQQRGIFHRPAGG